MSYIARIGLPAIVLIAGVVLPGVTVQGEDKKPEPDGVCYPVNGTGHVISHRDPSVPIIVTSLTPLTGQDVLVVETGSITYYDFHTRLSVTHEAPAQFTVPEEADEKKSGVLSQAMKLVLRSLKPNDKQRMGGSVRGEGLQLWPTGGRYAPDLPMVFEWSGVRPAPVTLEIRAGESVTELAVPASALDHGSLAWRTPAFSREVKIVWRLLGPTRQQLGSGYFRVLTAEKAEAERTRFREEATGETGIPRDLEAACLAAAEWVFLW